MAARPRSAQTEARSFRKLWLNTVRLPTGLPFGLPETPGGHIRPCTCLLGSRAFFCFLLLICALPPHDLRPFSSIAPPSAADNARYFRVAPNNLRVVTNVDHNVHTILDPKNRDRALLAVTQLCGVKAPLTTLGAGRSGKFGGTATTEAQPKIYLVQNLSA